MRVAIHDNEFALTPALRHYAEARICLAVQSVADRVAWVGVRPVSPSAAKCTDPGAWQVDAWVRGLGLVSVRQSSNNPFIGVDRAAARVEHTIAQRLRAADPTGESLPLRLRPGSAAAQDRPRQAVLVMPQGHGVTDRLRRWMQEHHQVEELQALTLTAVEWHGMAARGNNAIATDRVGARLALCLLGHPVLIVVAAEEGKSEMAGVGRRSRQQVQRVVERIRSWKVPADVVGLWINTEDALEPVETVEAARSAPPELIHAYSVWENEGGRVPQPASTGSGADLDQRRMAVTTMRPSLRLREAHPRSRPHETASRS